MTDVKVTKGEAKILKALESGPKIMKELLYLNINGLQRKSCIQSLKNKELITVRIFFDKSRKRRVKQMELNKGG